MKRALIILIGVMVSTSASAFTLTIEIPAGDGLTRLAKLCDWLRTDSSINKPAMSNQECGERLFLRGAYEFNHDKKIGELRAAAIAASKVDDDAFHDDLPAPPTGLPSPTPTSTPTAAPTPTP